MKMQRIVLLMTALFSFCFTGISYAGTADKFLDDMEEGFSITVPLGIEQRAREWNTDSPDFKHFGDIEITLIRRGIDTAEILTEEEKEEIMDLAYEYILKAKERGTWNLGCGALLTLAYKYAYERMFLGEDFPVTFDNINSAMPRMFYERIQPFTCKTDPPFGSFVYFHPDHIGFGVGNGQTYDTAKGSPISHHYLKEHQVYRRAPKRGGFRMPSFTYRNRVGIGTFKRNPTRVFRTLSPWEINIPDFGAFKESDRYVRAINRSQSQGFVWLLPGTIIKLEFTPAPDVEWDGWGGITQLETVKEIEFASNYEWVKEYFPEDGEKRESVHLRDFTKEPIYIKIGTVNRDNAVVVHGPWNPVCEHVIAIYER